ncbi:restriction endonuclease subunit S [Gordonia zhaorongruii]|uniref:restriction endonuclease subunit S n=1 Tax=Gordonia zhaorongruii TaxID=2597659 RepID=UPI001042D260|nr:restriction endonuclease subunit S [Gordonia zhaorongruii]
MNTTQTLPLVSITAWSSGGTPSRSNGAYWNGTIPWISAATLKGSRIDGSDQRLTEAGLRAGSNLAPKGATLVLVRGMALHRETRIGLAQLPVSFNQDVKALVPKAGILPEFLLYALQARTSQIRELVSSAGSGTGVLNTQLLQRLPIWVPSEETQHAVVEAVSDADALIDSLERFIVKKQAIKQGVMQQLLTGRTRLPGFSRDWADLRAGELGMFKGGSGFAPRYQGGTSGPIPFFKVSDMNNEGNELFMRRANNYITESQRKSMAAVLMPAEAIVFAKVGAAVFLERKRVLTVPSCIDNNMAAYVVDKGRVDVRFMHYFLSNFPMSSLVATGALPSLNGGQLRSIPVSLPTELDEQRAIAAALADSDAEIGVLHTRLIKARDTKTGMLQQLLTGRTRLPVEVAS